MIVGEPPSGEYWWDDVAPHRVWTVSAVGGLFRSDDDGATWRAFRQ